MPPFSRLLLENPALLPLLALAFLPLLLHLLDRRRARVVEWPAMQFLVPRDRGRVRWIQRRESILILLRSILIVLIVLALLRPYSTREQAVARHAGSRSRGVALLIDTSASMAYRGSAAERSSLDKAREAALEILDGCSPGDEAAVWTQATPAGETIPRAPDLEATRKRVQELAIEGGSFKILDLLDRAAEWLPRLTAQGREVYILTDLQASSLPERSPARFRFVAERLRAGGTPPAIRLIDCGSAHPVNRWVASLETDALAAGTDEAADIRASVDSMGLPEGQEPIPLQLVADGAVVESASARARQESGAQAAVELPHKFPASGEIRLSAEIPGDGLREDDSRRSVVEVLDRIDVLILGQVEGGEAAGAARFVDLALVPRASELTAPPSIFRPALDEEVSAEALGRCRVLVAARLRRIEPAAAAFIEKFVRDGGGFILFAGGDADSESWTSLLYRGGRGILPAALEGGARGTSRSGADVHPGEVSTQHPALAIFKDPEEGDLGRIAIRQWSRVSGVANDARVLARIDAEAPWILERPAGAGKVILFTTSAAPDDSDLPRTPLFLPLLHRLVRYAAARDSASSSLLSGEPISLPLPAGGTGEVILPSGKRIQVAATAADGAPRLVFRNTAAPGFYEARIPEADGSGRIAVHTMAVNMPLEESRLDRLPDDALADLRSALGVELRGGSREAAGAAVTETVKAPLWPVIIALAIAFLFAEQLLSRTFTSSSVAVRRTQSLPLPPSPRPGP